MTTEVKYGLVTAVAMSLWVLLEYLLGFHTTHLHIGRYTGFFSTVIPIVTVYYTLKEKRDSDLGGTLTLTQGMITGLLMCMVTAVCVTAFMWVYYTTINPGFVDAYLEAQLQDYIKEGSMDQQGAALARAEAKKGTIMKGQLMAGLVGIVLGGLLITFIHTLILRRDRSPLTDEQMVND